MNVIPVKLIASCDFVTTSSFGGQSSQPVLSPKMERRPEDHQSVGRANGRVHELRLEIAAREGQQGMEEQRQRDAPQEVPEREDVAVVGLGQRAQKPRQADARHEKPEPRVGYARHRDDAAGDERPRHDEVGRGGECEGRFVVARKHERETHCGLDEPRSDDCPLEAAHGFIQAQPEQRPSSALGTNPHAPLCATSGPKSAASRLEVNTTRGPPPFQSAGKRLRTRRSRGAGRRGARRPGRSSLRALEAGRTVLGLTDDVEAVGLKHRPCRRSKARRSSTISSRGHSTES